MKNKKLKNFFLKIDQFGAPFFFNTSKNEIKHHTLLGGIYSFFLILLVGIFAFYRIFLWMLNEIPPIINQFNGVPENRNFTIAKEQMLKINLVDLSGNNYSPELIYFIPYILYDEDYDSNNSSKYQLFEICQLGKGFAQFCLNPKSLTQGLNLYKNYSYSSGFSLYIAKCNQTTLTFLNINGTCASNGEINQLFQNSYLSITMKLQKYDYKNLQNQIFQKEFYFYLNQKMFFASINQITQENLIYNNGYPFNNLQSETFISDVNFYGQSFESDSLSPFLNQQFAQFYVILSDAYPQTTITKQSLVDLILVIFSFFRFFYLGGTYFFYQAQLNLKKRLFLRLNRRTLDQKEKNIQFFDRIFQIKNIFLLVQQFEREIKRKKQKRYIKEEIVRKLEIELAINNYTYTSRRDQFNSEIKSPESSQQNIFMNSNNALDYDLDIY